MGFGRRARCGCQGYNMGFTTFVGNVVHKLGWIGGGGNPLDGPYAYIACRCGHHYNFHR